MRPIKFTVKNGKTTFHYPFSFLKEFVTIGKRDGTNGMILIGRNGNMFSYKGFGTIENPRTTIRSFHMQHLSLFFGVMPTDESQLLEPESPFKNVGLFIPVGGSYKLKRGV